jgi:hypothetical protein
VFMSQCIQACKQSMALEKGFDVGSAEFVKVVSIGGRLRTFKRDKRVEWMTETVVRKGIESLVVERVRE